MERVTYQEVKEFAEILSSVYSKRTDLRKGDHVFLRREVVLWNPAYVAEFFEILAVDHAIRARPANSDLDAGHDTVIVTRGDDRCDRHLLSRKNLPGEHRLHAAQHQGSCRICVLRNLRQRRIIVGDTVYFKRYAIVSMPHIPSRYGNRAMRVVGEQESLAPLLDPAERSALTVDEEDFRSLTVEIAEGLEMELNCWFMEVTTQEKVDEMLESLRGTVTASKYKV